MTNWRSFRIESIEKEIVSYLDAQRKVYLEDGCLVDEITGYEWDNEIYKDRYWFYTSASVFPKKICLEDADETNTEDFNGALFVKI